eukprot:scaffold11837_cov67-Phaeocystis_antarctica.AAC.3
MPKTGTCESAQGRRSRATCQACVCAGGSPHRVELAEQHIHVRGEVNSGAARAMRRSQVGPRERPRMHALRKQQDRDDGRPHVSLADREGG